MFVVHGKKRSWVDRSCALASAPNQGSTLFGHPAARERRPFKFDRSLAIDIVGVTGDGFVSIEIRQPELEGSSVSIVRNVRGYHGLRIVEDACDEIPAHSLGRLGSEQELFFQTR
ncbi:hypothetical protein [Agrobacterium sp. P15N1-A]|uniref:hypothetical protein n=1 Tax=Agrobacterium sp. P15N1-A TaxID=3342820 RepID=UPI0037DC647E